MKKLVPNRFLFDFEFPLRYRPALPALTGRLTDWTDEFRLPFWGELDGARPFAELWACWHETGLALACRVAGKTRPPRCDLQKFWKGDNLRVCTDMRDARDVKRAGRHCQQFYLLPTGSGASGQGPVAGSAEIARAREQAELVPPGRLPVAARVGPSEYQLEAHLPAEILAGFDPAEHPRIGFYYMLEDGELGQQYLTVGDDLNWHVDPSTWATAVLQR